MAPLVDEIWCINLKKRKDRKQTFAKQAKKLGMKIKWWTAKENTNDPQQGRLAAHMTLIAHARKRRVKSIMIFEDDALVLTQQLSLPQPPKGWDMLWLGGSIQHVMDHEETNRHPSWKRVCALTTHAYVIHYKAYQRVLQASRQDGRPETLEQLYCQVLHPELNVFMLTPQRVVQHDGWSDVHQCERIFAQRMTQIGDEATMDVPDELDSVLTTFDPSTGGKVLSLPGLRDQDQLPLVTVITTTGNNKSRWCLTQRCFFGQHYPREKIHWIVADDGNPENAVREYIPQNDRYKYIKCAVARNSSLSLGKKLNLCMTYIDPACEYVVVMAEDTWYPPTSVASRVAALQKFSDDNQEKHCIGCVDFGVHNPVVGENYVTRIPEAKQRPIILANESLAFRKSWWSARSFDEDCVAPALTAHHFAVGRWEQVATMDYPFVFTKLSFDKEARLSDKQRQECPTDFAQDFDDITRELMAMCAAEVQTAR